MHRGLVLNEIGREQDAELRRAFGPLRDKALTVSSYVESALPGLDTPGPRTTKVRFLQLSAAAAAGFLLSLLFFQPWRWPEAPPPIADAPPPVIPSTQTDAAHLEVAAGTIEIQSPDADTWVDVVER